MQSKQQVCNLISRTISRAATAAMAIAIVFALMVVVNQSAQAQTYKVLYNFTGGQDGAEPFAGLVMDNTGNLYGTAEYGGQTGGTCGDHYGCGTVFKLSHKSGGWQLTTLYSFGGGTDGSSPLSIITGPNGGLYGTTVSGGVQGAGCGDFGCGTVFSLRPYPTACKTALCGWQETVLYGFKGGSDGANPGLGTLIFDKVGNIYGTTGQAGLYNFGTVYELTPSNGGFTESVLYAFSYGNDGGAPASGVILDESGNLYGTAGLGLYNAGVVYELSPSGFGWSENVLYAFNPQTDGVDPVGGLISDQSGNLYGTTIEGGPGNGGTIYQLSPSNGGWIFNLLYSFNYSQQYTGPGPTASLVMDAAGNLYGTTYYDGAHGLGSVFKLTRSNDGWIYTDLHDFTNGDDGGLPACNVILDANGNLYGTTSDGGDLRYCGGGGCGVVWEITP